MPDQPVIKSPIKHGIAILSKTHILPEEVSKQICVKSVKIHEEKVAGVAIHPTENIMVTCSYSDKSVKVWDTANINNGASHIVTLTGHAGAVLCVAINPTIPIIVTGGKDNVIKLWKWDDEDLSSIRCVSTSDECPINITSLVFLPGHDIFVANSGILNAELWHFSKDGKTLTLGHILDGHRGRITCTAVNRTGKMIATGSEDKTARLWKIREDKSATYVILLEGHGRGHGRGSFSIGGVTSICFHTNQDIVFTGGCEGNIIVWSHDDSSARCLITLTGNCPQPIISIAVNPKNPLIVATTCRLDNLTTIWQLSPNKSSARQVGTLIGASDGANPNATAFSSDGKFLAIVDDSGNCSFCK